MALLREGGISCSQGTPNTPWFISRGLLQRQLLPTVALESTVRISSICNRMGERVREWGHALPHRVSVPPVLHKVLSYVLLQDRSLLLPVHSHFRTAANLGLTSGTGRRRDPRKPRGCMRQQLCNPMPVCPAYQNMPISLLRLMSLLIWQTEHTGHHRVMQ